MSMQVPMAYVKNNEIVLNIGANATHKPLIDNEYVSFSARFSGCRTISGCRWGM